jgi:hypothetical protein
LFGIHYFTLFIIHNRFLRGFILFFRTFWRTDY